MFAILSASHILVSILSRIGYSPSVIYWKLHCSSCVTINRFAWSPSISVIASCGECFCRVSGNHSNFHVSSWLVSHYILQWLKFLLHSGLSCFILNFPCVVWHLSLKQSLSVVIFYFLFWDKQLIIEQLFSNLCGFCFRLFFWKSFSLRFFVLKYLYLFLKFPILFLIIYFLSWFSYEILSWFDLGSDSSDRFLFLNLPCARYIFPCVHISCNSCRGLFNGPFIRALLILPLIFLFIFVHLSYHSLMITSQKYF